MLFDNDYDTARIFFCHFCLIVSSEILCFHKVDLLISLHIFIFILYMSFLGGVWGELALGAIHIPKLAFLESFRERWSPEWCLSNSLKLIQTWWHLSKFVENSCRQSSWAFHGANKTICSSKPVSEFSYILRGIH